MFNVNNKNIRTTFCCSLFLLNLTQSEKYFIHGLYFPAFGLNTSEYLSVSSPNAGKYGAE